jgi:hypothetical protein
MKLNKLSLTAIFSTALLALGTVPAHAAALQASDFGTLQADITGTIGVVASIGVALMVVGMGWDIGISLAKKFVKKGAK